MTELTNELWAVVLMAGERLRQADVLEGILEAEFLYCFGTARADGSYSALDTLWTET